jgi:hypothetical protein
VFPGRRRTRRSRAAILVRGQRASEAHLGSMDSAIAADERADDARRGESLIGFGPDEAAAVRDLTGRFQQL